MKKLHALILAALLGCMLSTALAAESFTISEIQDAEGYRESFRSMAISDAVHLLSTRRNLYALDTETQQAMLVPMRNANPECEQIPQTALDFYEIAKDEAVPDWLKKDASLIDLLFWDGEALYGVNELNGALYRVEIAGGEAILRATASLDFFSGIDKECMPSIRSGAACDGFLYLLMSLGADEGWPSLYRFDMATGACELIKEQGAVIELARYRGNHLLLRESTSDSQWRISDFDTATGACKPLFESDRLELASENASGLAYDPWRERVLLQVEQEVLALVNETDCEVVGYLPPVWFDCRDMAEDGRLVLAGESVYALSTLQEKRLDKPLQVACDDLEDWMNEGFAEAHPGIAVKHRQASRYEAAALFAEQITLRSDEIDIFELPIGSASQGTLEKGYYTPLHTSEFIREKMKTYRPFFRQAVMNGDELAAIPRKAEQHTLAYSRFALDALGLTAEDMPSSFMELMDFLLEWEERVGDAAREAEITPFSIPNDLVKASLFGMLEDQYYLLMEKDASVVALYEAELAALLDKLSLACAAIPEGMEEEQNGTLNERFGHIKINNRRSYLFSVWASFLPGQRNFSYRETFSDFVPLALSLPSQACPLVLFEGTLFVLNPYSVRKEQAMKWLAYYMEHMPAAEAAAFDRDASPVESEMYSSMKEYFTEELGRLQPRMEAAEGAAKSELEAKIQIKQDQLRGIEQIKWDVSEQALEDYERMFDRCAVLWNDRVSAGSFDKTYAAYINEGLPGETVAHEFFAAHEMVLMEAR